MKLGSKLLSPWHAPESPAPTLKDQSMVREFISWKSLKLLINDCVFDQCIRDKLKDLNKGDLIGFGNTIGQSHDSLEKDHLKIMGLEVGFIVSRGRLFFEKLGAFTVLGELNLAMRNKWQEVDLLLQEGGLKPKDAFRRCHKKTNKEMKAYYSHRSHVSFKAMIMLLKNGFVKNQVNVFKTFLLCILIHI